MKRGGDVTDVVSGFQRTCHYVKKTRKLFVPQTSEMYE